MFEDMIKDYDQGKIDGYKDAMDGVIKNFSDFVDAEMNEVMLDVYKRYFEMEQDMGEILTENNKLKRDNIDFAKTLKEYIDKYGELK